MDDLTPRELNDWLLRLSKEVGEAIKEVRVTASYVAEADRDYKAAYSKAYLRADGPVKERECQADLDTAHERYMAKIAEGKSRSADLALRARMAQLSALQSVASSVRQHHKWGQTAPEESLND